MAESSVYERAQRIAEVLRERSQRQPSLVLVLGSGLGAFADEKLEDPLVIPYREIPEFPQTSVKGHKGNLVFGRIGGQDVVVMQGRMHYYESRDLIEATLPMRVMKLLGVDTLFVTNSSGGVNPEFDAGDLMLITDHINMMSANPLMGENDARFGARFPDMSEAYDSGLREIILSSASTLGIQLRQGIYCAVTGPSYETPAEIRMLQTLGADAVGMSTVPEVLVAHHMKMRCVGISCVTNLGAGLTAHPLSHEEVTETAGLTAKRFGELVYHSVQRILS